MKQALALLQAVRSRVMVAVAPDAVERYVARPCHIELVPDDGEWFVALAA